MPSAKGIFYQLHEGIVEGIRPSLVLIHGAGGNHLYWHPQIRRLVKNCVYAIDLPGHGRSSGSGEQEIQPYAESVHRWFQGVGLHSAVIAGHSMGGAVALTLAHDYPDQVSGLVLVSSAALFNVDPLLLEQSASATTYYHAIETLVSKSFSASAPERLLEQATKRMEETRHSVLHGDLIACSQFNQLDKLADIQVPTLVLCGEEDRLTPTRYSRYLQSNIPNAHLEVVPNAGHMVMLEQPQVVAQILTSFLNQIPF